MRAIQNPTLSLIACIAGLSWSAASQTAVEPKAPAPLAIGCSKEIGSVFRSEKTVRVLVVKRFHPGDALSLAASPSENVPTVAADICLVKLLVGPGNKGAESAPSTSDGIGIEVWLPSQANWNGRIHLLGGGGWAGGAQGLADRVAVTYSVNFPDAASIASIEGAVSATTDTGHSSTTPMTSGSFALNPDGSSNATLWRDFSERGIHEMVLKTKALSRAFYGENARYTYWDGFSTGGRQGLKLAQEFPDDVDGILSGAPAINWTRFITTELYPQIVMQRDLGHHLSKEQLIHVSRAAIDACDVVGGAHLGYIVDPAECHYDPTHDPGVLCQTSESQPEKSACLTPVEAQAINKFWFGQTSDGSVPDPSTDNGFALQLSAQHRWYGVARGSDLRLLAGADPFSIASDLVALELGDARISTPAFITAGTHGMDGWKNLTYAHLNSAADAGIKSQISSFARIDTDNPDLARFASRDGRLLQYHGYADQLIPPQGSMQYFERVLSSMGGEANIHPFYRLYMIPGMGHGFSKGSPSGANPPLPRHLELYEMLTAWVEQQRAPEEFLIASDDAGAERTWRVCPYPKKPVYRSGSAMNAESYLCH